MKIQIIAQIFGIFGLIFNVLSYQMKENKKVALVQGIGGLLFFINYAMIGAVAGALLNIATLMRGILFAKNTKKVWKLVVVEVFIIGSTGYAVVMNMGDGLQIALSLLIGIAILGVSFFMWYGDGKKLRYFQSFVSSPAWMIHNIFNFTLGGIICEALNMLSVAVSFIRFGKKGFSP